eukprot:m.8110 g.8110  ORF g.8110 m.8110 type:complete len:596 (+) comp3013_c0_seq1:109-1896(+)
MPVDDTDQNGSQVFLLRKQNEVLLKEMLMMEWKLNKLLEENDVFAQELERKDLLVEKLKQDLEEGVLSAQRDLSNMVQKSDYDRLQDLQKDTERKLKTIELELRKMQDNHTLVEDQRQQALQAKEAAEDQLAAIRDEVGDSRKNHNDFQRQLSQLQEQHALELQQLQTRERGVKDHYEEQMKNLRNDISEGHKTQQQLNVQIRQLENQARLGEQRIVESESQMRDRYEKMLIEARRELEESGSSHQTLNLKIRQLEAEVARLLELEKLWKQRERQLKEHYENQARRLRFAEGMSMDKHLVDRLFDERVSAAIQQQHLPQSVSDNTDDHGMPRSRLLQHLAGVRVQNLKKPTNVRKQQHSHPHNVIPGGRPMRVRHNYDPSEVADVSVPQREQLSLKKGEVLVVQYPSQRRDGFVRVQTTSGEVGFAPKAFLEPMDSDANAKISQPISSHIHTKRNQIQQQSSKKNTRPSMQQVLGGDVRPNEHVRTRNIVNNDVSDEEEDEEEDEDNVVVKNGGATLRNKELLEMNDPLQHTIPNPVHPTTTTTTARTTTTSKGSAATLMSRDELDFAIKSTNTKEKGKGISRFFNSQRRSYNPR